jgi:hypothetical protein
MECTIPSNDARPNETPWNFHGVIILATSALPFIPVLTCASAFPINPTCPSPSCSRAVQLKLPRSLLCVSSLMAGKLPFVVFMSRPKIGWVPSIYTLPPVCKFCDGDLCVGNNRVGHFQYWAGMRSWSREKESMKPMQRSKISAVRPWYEMRTFWNGACYRWVRQMRRGGRQSFCEVKTD